MNTGTMNTGSRKMRVVKGLLLQAATTALVAACGGVNDRTTGIAAALTRNVDNQRRLPHPSTR